ncbi:MAG TPA: hypothetical protein VGZ69_07165 [Candidatus Rhabdochlamydia sp.]|jgi:hypothetical protein|nr:hypothetical protein [Candidatus Rhabdochlamydia sp.]
MAINLDFFIPVRFEEPKTFKQHIQEGIDDYFYLGGRSAFVISREISDDTLEVIIQDQYRSRIKQVILGAIKIISYITVIIPLLMLIAKTSFRSTHKFHVISKAEPMFNQSFLIIDKASFWDHYLISYANVINDNEWDSVQGLSFLTAEFQEIQGSLRGLLDKIQNEHIGDPKKIELEGFIHRLIDKTAKSLEMLQKKLEDKASPKGLGNVGNTCYMNSALQPLLAIRQFKQLIPDNVASEPEFNYEKRKKILASFKDFFTAWEDKETSANLGHKVGALRREIFEAGLLEGGFLDRDQERNFQDAGQFFELILHVLGKGFQLEMTRTPVKEDGTSIETSKKIEKTPEGVFYLKLSGNSLQEIVNGHKEALDQEFDLGDEWKVEDPNARKEILVSRCKEMQKIVGPAPEILVVRVNNYVVNEQDQTINFTPLFKEPSENCNYQLVGFSQNHYQVHWTSVVWKENHWHYCNDSQVQQVSSESPLFKHPANYMIFQRKK